MDGTDQMINGFPHYWQTSKKDAKGKRLYLHTQIAIVHGSQTYAFVAHEDIAGDPNWTIETLYRVLRAEERKRPLGLPKTLYLQLDNCFRENKNAYVIAWLCWLIERHVFDEVFLSFLPTGHTHFDPDQFASRISLALRFQNVTTIQRYMDVIGQSLSNETQVEVVANCMDTKELFNPGKEPALPVGVSRCRQVRGIGTKTIQIGRDWFMGLTSPLHWRMRKDIEGRTFVQSKHTVDDQSWSQTHYPWTDAPRPRGRVFADRMSGLLPKDLTLAPNNPCSEARTKELKEALSHVTHRLNATAQSELNALYDLVTTARQAEMPDGYGRFNADDLDFDKAIVPPAPMLSRQTIVFSSQSHTLRERARHKQQGHASRPLAVGDHVAYAPDYTDDCAKESRQDFWVGQIIALGADTNQVHLKRYNTGTINNLTSKTANYKVWTGKDPTEWIPLSRVFEVFELTAKNKLVPAPTLRSIGNAITLYQTCLNSRNAGPDMAVGTDMVENPSGTGVSQQEIDEDEDAEEENGDDDDSK